MLDLFLHKDLAGWDLVVKAKGAASAAATGEQRGGSYIARVQRGYEKDGSPKYRYFTTEKEYESYLSGAGRGKEASKEQKKKGEELGDKQEKERAEQKKKQSKLFTGANKKDKGKKDKDKKNKKVEKSLPILYLEVDDE